MDRFSSQGGIGGSLTARALPLFPLWKARPYFSKPRSREGGGGGGGRGFCGKQKCEGRKGFKESKLILLSRGGCWTWRRLSRRLLDCFTVSWRKQRRLRPNFSCLPNFSSFFVAFPFNQVQFGGGGREERQKESNFHSAPAKARRE